VQFEAAVTNLARNRAQDQDVENNGTNRRIGDIIPILITRASTNSLFGQMRSIPSPEAPFAAADQPQA
jgi:hypothetical protein